MGLLPPQPENVFFQRVISFQDGERLQQLHVQKVLPSLLEGQPKASLASPEEARGRTSCTGILQPLRSYKWLSSLFFSG